MENLHFSNSSSALRYLRRNGEEIYDGVYKMQDGTLIKRYNKQKSLERSDDFSEDNLLVFKDIYIEGIVFTRALLHSSLKNIYATIVEYVPGISIDKKNLGSYLIDDLINAIEKLEVTIKKISELGICATDIYRGNMVYDGKRITLIDTIEYHYGGYDCSVIYEENMLGIMNEVFSSIFYNGHWESIKNIHKYFSFRGSELEYFNSVGYLMNPCDTLIQMRKFMEEDFGIRLNTFNECHPFIEDVIMKEGNRGKTLLLVRR